MFSYRRKLAQNKVKLAQNKAAAYLQQPKQFMSAYQDYCEDKLMVLQTQPSKRKQ